MKKVLFSVLLVSGSAWLCWGIYFYFWNTWGKDPKYHIIAILQTGPEKEALKTSFLAELLHLSIDRPINLYRFPLKQGEQALLDFPLIKKAVLKRIPPGTLYIDYEIRKPIAFIGDFSNTAIDAEGFLLPFKPFYSPKRLTEIILGINKESHQWGDQLQSAEIQLAFTMIKDFSEVMSDERMALLKIDVSRIKAPSLGEQQVTLILEKQRDAKPLSHWTLILNPEAHLDGLNRFKAFMSNQSFQEGGFWVLDLRLEQLGYVTQGTSKFGFGENRKNQI